MFSSLVVIYQISNRVKPSAGRSNKPNRVKPSTGSSNIPNRVKPSAGAFQGAGTADVHESDNIIFVQTRKMMKSERVTILTCKTEDSVQSVLN